MTRSKCPNGTSSDIWNSSVRNLVQARPDSWHHWLLPVFLAVAFLIGGGARSDIQSLVVLRPLAAAVVMFGFWFLTKEQVRSQRFLFVFAGLLFAIVIAHLVPLPSEMWQMLPGRAVTTEIDRVMGLNNPWRPVSLVPAATWNAFFALLVPLAVLVFAAQLERERLFWLIRVVLVAGLMSAVVGLFQAVGPANGPLHFYRITNEDMAVGLFANRNHQAVFLATMFPMLAVFASGGSGREAWRRWGALIAGAVLVPLILVTGSRAGLIAAVVGLAASAILYRSPEISGVVVNKSGWRRYARQIAIAGGAVFLGAVTILMARAEAISRLLAGTVGEEQRLQTLGPILDAAWSYFPVGAGVGSFAEVYQVHEPVTALSFNYLNHAHNDWAELLLTAGLPGAILLLVALGAYARSVWRVFMTKNASARHVQYGRLGAVIIFILGLASVADYPLRVPSISCLFVLAAVWLSQGAKSEQANG